MVEKGIKNKYADTQPSETQEAKVLVFRPYVCLMLITSSSIPLGSLMGLLTLSVAYGLNVESESNKFTL